MKNAVFVTGSTGFLGKNLVEELSKEKNILIYCLVQNKTRGKEIENIPNTKLIVGDITEPKIIDKLPKKVTTIFHLAGIISNANYKKNYEVNVLGTKNIIKIAKNKNVNKLIHISSINVDFKKKGAYSITKKLGEEEVRKSGINSIIFRPSQIYGEGDHGFNKIIKYVNEGAIVPIVGDGKKYEQPIYVKELVELIILAYRKKIKGQKLFYVAGKDKIKFNELIELFEKYYGKKKFHLHIPKSIALITAKTLSYLMSTPPITDEQVYHIDTNTLVDIKKSQKIFKHKQYDLKETIKSLIEKGSYKTSLEVDKGLKHSIGGKIQNIRVLKNLILKKPILVIFDITKRCNQRCNTCNIWKKGNIKNEMSLQKIKGKLDVLKKFGIGYAFIQGGDPLMRKDIEEITIECIKRNIKPTIITNGLALNPRLLSFFSEQNCNLSISLDTLNRDTYKKIRGVDGLERALKNIELAKAYKRKGNWSITTTVTQMNYKEIWELEKFAKSNGLMYAIRPYIYSLGKAGKADKELIYKTREKIVDVFKEMVRKAENNNYLASLVYRMHVKYLIKGDIGRCDAMERSFLLQEDGSCSPCVEKPDIVFNKKEKEFEKDFKHQKGELNPSLVRCSHETPCFYNDAREIGIIWNSKLKIILHLPRVIKNLVKYGNFF